MNRKYSLPLSFSLLLFSLINNFWNNGFTKKTPNNNAFYLLSSSELMCVHTMCHNFLWSCTLVVGTLVLLLSTEFSDRLQTYSKTSFPSLSQRSAYWLSHNNCIFERHSPSKEHYQKDKADGTLTTAPKKHVIVEGITRLMKTCFDLVQ